MPNSKEQPTITVDGPFVVRGPVRIYNYYTERNEELYQVINEGNLGISDHAAIALSPDKYNAHWVANALNMLKAIDDAALLRRTPAPPLPIAQWEKDLLKDTADESTLREGYWHI